MNEINFLQKIKLGTVHYCRLHTKPYSRVIWGDRKLGKSFLELKYLKEFEVDVEGKLIVNKK